MLIQGGCSFMGLLDDVENSGWILPGSMDL